MTPKTLFAGLADRYGTIPDYPWAAKHPQHAVFRHESNEKWFCLYMPVAAERLGRKGGMLDVLNVKTRPENIGALRQQAGVLPAYHMNKEHWVSLLLDEAAEETVWQCIADSFALTR